MQKKDVFAIYFPSWHPDAHYEKWYGKGFSEWELIRSTRPLYDGHHQPKQPLWGFFDESDPEVMERQIELALSHHITGFMFDWYWYGGEQFLEKPLNDAFLKVASGSRMKFSLMWANHNWGIWPALGNDAEVGMNGSVNQSKRLFLHIHHSEEDLRKVAAYIAEHYFSRENYWKIDGRPVFSFFSTDTLFRDLEPARVIEIMNEESARRGFGNIYFLMNVGCCNDNLYFCGWGKIPRLKAAGYDAVFAYNSGMPGHLFKDIPQERPVFDYRHSMEAQEFCWNKLEEGGLPVFRSVTLGNDVSPRWNRNVRFPMDFQKLGYCPITENVTPENFGELFRKALDSDTSAVIINAWNEWTEGEFLLPEAQYGTGYLDAVREIMSC